MPGVRQATREQVLAFRLDGHNLVERRPPGALLEVAGACGVRNTPPGSAALALHARVGELSPEAVDRALGEDKTLVEVLGMRASPHLVPAVDLAVFTLGALPTDEASLHAALHSLASLLDTAALPAAEALRQAADAAWAELEGGMLARGALSAGMTRRLPPLLSPYCAACGARHVHEMLFRLVGVRGTFLIARQGRTSGAYVRTDQWLGAVPSDDPPAARAELLRRYLRCFGPSSVEHFAEWVGIAPAEARRGWDALVDAMVEVDVGGSRAWLHAADVARFESPPTPTGARLLPPYDSYLDQRDRGLLLPDKAVHRQLWKAIGNPGAVLVGQEVVGLWKQQKKGKRLALAVEAFMPLSRASRDQIEAEAVLLPPYRGCTSVEVSFGD